MTWVFTIDLRKLHLIWVCHIESQFKSRKSQFIYWIYSWLEIFNYWISFLYSWPGKGVHISIFLQCIADWPLNFWYRIDSQLVSSRDGENSKKLQAEKISATGYDARLDGTSDENSLIEASSINVRLATITDFYALATIESKCDWIAKRYQCNVPVHVFFY